MTFPTISMEQLEGYVDRGMGLDIIDLRNHASYQKCHFRGAVNIPLSELEDRLESLNKNKILVFYCSRGGQSLLACSRLSRMGYQVVNIANGISFYRGKYMECYRNNIDR